MEALLVLFALTAVGVLVGGSVCGLVAVTRLGPIRRELAAVTARLRQLEQRLAAAGAPAAETAPKPVAAAPPPREEPAVAAAPPPPPPPPSTTRDPLPPLSPPPPPRVPATQGGSPSGFGGGLSIEGVLGTKALGWVGAFLVMIGMAFFLKWAYDRQLIPPEGRLAIGALAGVAALGLGERFRRRGWMPLFQTLTGIGIAVFYLCIFFSFHVYAITGQTASFGLGILVTVLAVVLAVAHNALPIAILGVIGGFLSPVIFTSGGNHPYGLFSYVLLVDLVALGAAYFRRWRALDLLCFLGTVALYQAWLGWAYTPEQRTPALLFVSIFYALFLAIPTLYSLARRIPEGVDGLALVTLNSIYSFFAYYIILYRDHRYTLGFVVLAQALLVFALFRVWQVRLERDSRTAKALLIIALALVTLAIPIQLRLYGIPLAWAAEGALFVWLGLRYREPLVRLGGVMALLLAAAGLLRNLPLHTLPFVPVVNAPFASWAFCIAATVFAAWLLYARRPAPAEGEKAAPFDAFDPFLAAGVFLLGFAEACALLSMEVSLFWTTRAPEHFRNYQFDSLVVLWTLIAAGTLAAVARLRHTEWLPLAAAVYTVAAFVFLGGLAHYEHPSSVFVLNATFLSKLLFTASLGWAAWQVRRGAFREEIALAFEVAANVALAVLVALELERWSQHTTLITERMAMALVSAAWAVQAFALIWSGLMLRKQPLRILGFVLFGVVLVKVLAFDTAELEQIYRIVSFMATGILLLAATWIYHRYSALFLEEPEPEELEGEKQT
jgi:uncharacterized membrane protein